MTTITLPPPWYPQWSHSNELAAYTADQMHAHAAAVSAAYNDVLREALALAYGHLWLVNDEPGTPIRLHSSGTAASIARKILRDVLTDEQRVYGITGACAALEQK
jgi:hypothetical protein